MPNASPKNSPATIPTLPGKSSCVEARGSNSWIAVRNLGYSGADVVRYLVVTNSCVNRFVVSGKKSDVDDHIANLCTLCLNIHLASVYRFVCL